MSYRLVIGTVHPGMVDAQFCQCLAATLSEDARSMDLHGRGRVIFQHAPAGMLHVARNLVVTSFLKHPIGLSHLLFIDADMTWRPPQVWQLLHSAVQHDLPMLSALVSMQHGPDLHESIPVMYDAAMQFVAPREDIQQVFCAGMAFMLIRRDVLESCLTMFDWPTPWFNYGAWHGKAVSEDVIFSQRLADLDIPIHVDTRIVVGHRKLHTYTAPPALACV